MKNIPKGKHEDKPLKEGQKYSYQDIYRGSMSFILIVVFIIISWFIFFVLY